MTSGLYPLAAAIHENYKCPDTTHQPYNSTAAKVAKVAGTIAATVAICGVLGLVGIGSLGLLPLQLLVVMVVVGGILSALLFLKAYWASRTKDPAFENFDIYVEKHCPGVTQEQAAIWAKEGSNICAALNRGESLEEVMKTYATPGKESDLCIPISWYFLRCAFNTKQGFRKGMIKFEDPGHRVAKFFESVMKKRHSSHFRKTRTSSVGQDVPEDLPFRFKHVHMGTLQDGPGPNTLQFSFIKLEEYGLFNVSEMIKHGADLVRAVTQKRLGEGNGPHERREGEIPKPVKKAFEQAKKDSSLTKAQAQQWSEARTVAQMVALAGKDIGFMAVLNEHFPRGNHSHRSGNEALLMRDDLSLT